MNNQSSKLKEITDVLVDLGAMLASLDIELERENQAIRHRDTDQLTSATSAKIGLLQSIEISSNSLANLMVKHGSHDEQLGLKKGALAFELGDIWTTFCERLEACNDKNTVNGRAIELSRASTDRIIGMLRGNDQPIYGRAGKMQDDYDIVTLAEA
jgi:flagellar biosynthesis/type III secretory pathway chaperone